MTKRIECSPQMLQKIRAGVEKGKTREQIASALKMTAKTLQNLAKKYPEVEDALSEKKTDDPGDIYNSTIPHQVLYLVATGTKTIAQMAEEIGIKERTWHEWREKYPEFRKATESGKRSVLGRVAESMISRASQQITVIEKDVKFQLKKNPLFGKKEGEEPYLREPYEEIERHRIHLPDIAAQKHVLGNLDPETWNSTDKPVEPVVPKREPTEAEKKMSELLKTMSPETKILLDKMEIDRPDIFSRWRRTGDASELIAYMIELDGGLQR